MPCSRRVIAFCLWLFPTLLIGQTVSPLDDLDGNFRKAYEAKAADLKQTDPPYIEVSGSSLFLHLHGQNPIKVKVLTEPYHHLKDVTHVPFTIYLMLSVHDNAVLSDEQIAQIHDLQTKLTTAEGSVASAGFEPAQLDRQRQVLNASILLLNGVLSTKTVDQNVLRTYTRAMAPLMLKNADDAGCFQVQATHKQILAWKPLFSRQEWENLHVVIKNSHQARYRNAATQYFAWLLGGSAPPWALPGETNRVVYAEALFESQSGGDELVDVLVDFDASREFFGDDWRMTEDILSNGAAKCVASLPNADRSWNSNPGVVQ